MVRSLSDQKDTSEENKEKTHSSEGKQDLQANREDVFSSMTEAASSAERFGSSDLPVLNSLTSEETTASKTELERGRDVLLKAVRRFPTAPGVYRMLDKNGEILYIGKAKNLKNRVTSYTHIHELNYRIQRMVSLVFQVVFTVTKSESEALFLEADLIRSIKPPYNVLLKESTPFVSISISKNHPFPRIAKHRGPKDETNEEYLGPFSSVKSVDGAMLNIQKIFRLRTCSDTYFAKRTRPCLQYDIRRCSAPCVHKISEEEYKTAVQNSRDFLAGKLGLVRDFLKTKMEAASEALDFERAARYRDTILRLEKLPTIEKISTGSLVDTDVIAIFQPQEFPDQESAESANPFEKTPTKNPKNLPPCIQVLFIRNRVYLGGDTFFLNKNASFFSKSENMSQFLQQFYWTRVPPARILVSDEPSGKETLQEALSQKYQKSVRIERPQRGTGNQWILQASRNAYQQSLYEEAKHENFEENLEKLAQVFVLPKVPKRVEIYDNSHLQGSYAYGCMVVATPEGFDKKSYRKFSVAPHKPEDSNVRGGSDFAMMEEVMQRRFRDVTTDDMPDLLILDGGAGQLSSVIGILESYSLDIPLLGIAKGPDRNAGRERFFLPGWAPFSLPLHDPVLHFLQRLRDEAHRFAIGTHRHARQVGLTKSQLSEIPGIGAVRKKALMRNFGSVANIRRASLEDLLEVKEIDKTTAHNIYQFFHAE